MTYEQISVKLPKELLQRLDDISKKSFKKRSELIREGIVEFTRKEAERAGSVQAGSSRDPLYNILEKPVTSGSVTDSSKEIDEVVFG